MFCPKCGTANDDGNRFCHQCSAALPTSDASGPAQGAGSRAAAPVAPTAHTATGGQKRRGNPIKSILLVIVLLVVAFFVYAALSPDSPAPGGADASMVGGSTLPIADDAQAQASESAGTGDASADGSSATDEAAADRAAAASSDAVTEVGDVRTMDVFDWNRASDDMKKRIAFACQMHWQVGGVTGEAVDIDSGELAKKIGAAMGEQDNIFDVACALYDLDPTIWQDTVN